MEDTLDREVNIHDDKLHVNQLVLDNLSTASGWAKFLAIVGFISSAFMMLAGIYNLYVATKIPAGFGLAEQFIVRGIILLVLGGILLIPPVYLLRFSNYARNTAGKKIQGDLEDAVENLKAYFKFTGIYNIVLLGIFVIGMLLAMM